MSDGEATRDRFGNFTRRLNTFLSRPLATIIAITLVVVWAICGPIFKFSDTWQLVINTSTTIITFLMVFLLNNAQSRDSAAMSAKLDEIVLALKGSDKSVAGLEEETDSTVDHKRQEKVAAGRRER